LESLRKELDDTKLMLQLQRKEYRGSNTAVTTKYGGARPEQHKSKKQGFLYLDPDEVASYWNENDGKNETHWTDDRDEVDCGFSMWSVVY
uniref:hypothetical protein n=1 Tax=Salmonella sp. s51884 TaxID=3159654 RepID=UPI00397F28C7